jgi:hypothetical protein
VFNIGPDGRIFFGVTNGSDVTGNTQKVGSPIQILLEIWVSFILPRQAIAWADSPYTAWTCARTGIAGIGGPNVAVGPMSGKPPSSLVHSF